MLQNTTSWREIHNQKTADVAYMEGMNPDNGPKQIVKDLTNKLLFGSHIFEYGVGPGANALYLVEQGYTIEVQDVSDKMLEIFQENAKKKSLEIPMINSPAQDHIPSGLYDAFVCTYLLHFMSDGDARKVITNMQKYTNIGGYNAIEIFTRGHPAVRQDRFYSNPEEILEIYTGWEICKKHLLSTSTDNSTPTHMKILFRKGE